MRPVGSFISALRSPLTALVVTTPSLAALPPNMPAMRPSMPSNFTCALSRVFTSATAGPAVNITSGRTIAQA